MRFRIAVAGCLVTGCLVTGCLLAGLGFSSMVAQAQAGTLPMPAPAAKSYVLYLAEDQDVHAGKRTVLELHFRVVSGFHVNSHTPNSALLIPTELALKSAAGVQAEAPQYPAGKSYSFSFDPATKLSVYTGDFVVKLPVVAEAGARMIHATLHYQACDHAACYPPHDLPVEVIFSAR